MNTPLDSGILQISGINPAGSYTLALILVFASMLFNGCKENPIVPPENRAPVIESFSANPTTAKRNDPVSFTFQGTDDTGLAQAIINYEPGVADTLAISGTAYTGTRVHPYTTSGAKTTSLVLKDKDGKTVSTSVNVSIEANLLPAFNQVTFAGAEGDTLEKKISDIVSDPEGRPLSLVTVTSLDPELFALIVGDRVRLYGSVDMNGSRQFKVIAKDAEGDVAERTYAAVFDPRDVILGRVFDAMEGQFATGIRPELSLTTGANTGNVTDGWVVVDNGPRIKPDKNGYFTYDKVKGGTHVLQAFLVGKE